MVVYTYEQHLMVEYLIQKAIEETKSSFVIAEEDEQYNYESTITNRHDKMYRDLLSDKEEAVDIINTILKLKSKLTSNDIEKYESKYITSNYLDRQADVVYKLKEDKIFFLIEHQSTIDYSMPYRMTEYTNAIMKEAIGVDNIKSKDYMFPLVVPIVIYTGSRKWNAKRNLSEIRRKLQGKEINNTYNLLDVNEIETDELLSSNMLIKRIMGIEKSKEKEVYSNIMKIVKEEKDIKNIKKIKRIVSYVFTGVVTDEEMQEIEKEIEKKEGNEAMSTINEKLKRYFKHERDMARKLGRAEGRVEGMVEEAIKIAKVMLEKNMPIEEIMQITEITEEDIKLLQNQ